MKKVLSIGAVMMLVFAAGLVYADDWPAWNSKDTIDRIGTNPGPVAVKDLGKGSAAGGHRADAVNRADEYNNDELPTFSRSPKAASSELQDAYLKEKAEAMKGSAPGGVRTTGPDRTNEFNNDDLYSNLFRR